jgi:hypothetical protein
MPSTTVLKAVTLLLPPSGAPLPCGPTTVNPRVKYCRHGGLAKVPVLHDAPEADIIIPLRATVANIAGAWGGAWRPATCDASSVAMAARDPSAANRPETEGLSSGPAGLFAVWQATAAQSPLRYIRFPQRSDWHHRTATVRMRCCRRPMRRML